MKSELELADELFGAEWVAMVREVYGEAADENIVEQVRRIEGRNRSDKRRSGTAETLSPVTGYNVFAYDQETSTRIDKVSVAMGMTSQHKFSAEYEAGYRARHAGHPITANPHSSKKGRDRWERGWQKRDRYTDSQHRWAEPVTDNKAVIYLIGFLLIIVLPIILGVHGIK